MKRILILGGGFAGLWSAVGAARKRDELGLAADDIEITLVNRDTHHAIRVRNYEPDLSPLRVPLDDVLEPIRVRRVEGDVANLDFPNQFVTVTAPNDSVTLPYDRLVFALGSQLARPHLPGLATYGHDVDTFTGAARLETHLKSLALRPSTPASRTVAIIGAGLTGIETAAEMPDRLRGFGLEGGRVILIDHNAHVGSDMGESARPVITEALAALGVQTRLGESVQSVGAESLRLQSGEEIPTCTTIWCAGMRAHPLTAQFPGERDPLGRLPVDSFLRVEGMANVFAAGDVARLMITEGHASVMSCQHARPMGRYAGHNVVCDLVGLPLKPLRIDWYVTVLDLGAWGAVYTEGWDRTVVATGAIAKATKEEINRRRINPPCHDRAAILAAGAAEVQTPPAYRGGT